MQSSRIKFALVTLAAMMCAAAMGGVPWGP
jgi:hypothetical protein